jgi:multiple sugar transport system substrate-binding protein
MDLIFFDSAAFDAAGLPHPAPGWTWDDFQQAARALTLREAGQTTRYGFVPARPTGAPISLLAPVMEAAVVQAGGALDPAALTELLGWYVDLADEGVMPVLKEDISAWQQTNSLIKGGQAVMWVDSINNLESRRETVGPAVMMAPLPVSELTSNTSPGSSPCVVMSAGTAHPRQAWTWLNFLTYHPVLLGDSPARPSVAESDGYWDVMSAKDQQALRFALEHAWYGNNSPYFDALHAINRAMLQAIAGEMDLTAALELNSDFAITTETPPVNETPIVVATPRPTASESLVTLDYYASGLVHPDLASVKTLAEEFNQTHLDVEVRPSNSLALEGSGFDIVDVAQQYDCLAWGGGVSAEMLEHIYSLDPFLARDARLQDDLDPALLNLSRVDGQLYALPAGSVPTMIYYNADYLELMDLAPPALDWTADDLLALARAATSGQGSDKTYGFVPLAGDPISFLFGALGARLYDLDGEPPLAYFDEQETVDALTWLADLVQEGIMPPYDSGGTRSLEGNYWERRELVTTGRAALWTDLAGLRSGFVAGAEAGFRMGMAPLPLNTASMSPPMHHALYISRQAENPDACWEWFEFLSEQPAAFNGVPARRSALESQAWAESVGAETAAALRAALLSRPAPSHRFDWALDRWLDEAMAATFMGENPATALAEAQSKADVYLDCLADAFSDDAAQREACAQEADPGYKTTDELFGK